ncbi:MAG: nitroreductase family protein [Eubacteriales bacterium]
MEEIFTRRSIRKFSQQPVEKEKIDLLLRAGMQAPSAHNQQPWEFIVVQNKDTLNKLSLTTPYSKPAAGSAVTLVLLANSKSISIESAWQQDMGASAENILLEATHLGLGAVWIGIATSDAAAENIKNLFRLPNHIRPFSLIAVGWPESAQNVFVDRYNESKVHYEKWQ